MSIWQIPEPNGSSIFHHRTIFLSQFECINFSSVIRQHQFVWKLWKQIDRHSQERDSKWRWLTHCPLHVQHHGHLGHALSFVLDFESQVSWCATRLCVSCSRRLVFPTRRCLLDGALHVRTSLFITQAAVFKAIRDWKDAKRVSALHSLSAVWRLARYVQRASLQNASYGQQ